MKAKIIIPIILFGLFIQCKNQNIEKTAKILAVNNYDFGGNIKFEYYSDSTYIFTINEKDVNHEKIEKFNDFCYSKDDTIYFSQVVFRYNGSKKAVIKNNFIEFIDGDFPLKIEIKKNLLQTKSKLDLKKYSDYAFFNFEPKFNGRYLHYKSNTIKPYDLNQDELVEVDQILKKCISENASKLRKADKYVKQCIVIINDKQEKEVLINCYCKDFHINKEYKYSLIDMSDGGNCNVSLKINLTKHTYSDLNIAGHA